MMKDKWIILPYPSVLPGFHNAFAVDQDVSASGIHLAWAACINAGGNPNVLFVSPENYHHAERCIMHLPLEMRSLRILPVTWLKPIDAWCLGNLDNAKLFFGSEGA